MDEPSFGGWNYRIVKRHNSIWWSLHEVFYDEDGNPNAMTTDPISFSSDESPEDVIEMLEMALKDAKTKPVFNEPKEWADD